MATITSPRSNTGPFPPPLPARSPLQTPSSSQRTSLDTARSSSPSRAPNAAAAAPAGSAPPRRNRALLRDYYGLKPPPGAPGAVGVDEGPAGPPRTPRDDAQVPHSAVDAKEFDPEEHVQEVLKREGLEGVLREGGRLVSEIKTLDGERAALVYDNYARLITATETIRQMRAHVGGELAATAGVTSTLGPAIAHIAGTAEALAATGASLRTRTESPGADRTSARDSKKDDVKTVRWVLDTPRRMKEQVACGSRRQAEEEWAEVRTLLGRWENVPGKDNVREACAKALGEEIVQKDEEP